MAGGLNFVVFGVPVRILPMFFLVSVVLGAGLGDPVLIAIWVAVVAVSILIHELGHAFAFRRFGAEPTIVLHGFGGLTFGRSLPVRHDLAVSLAGPAAGLAVGVPLLLLDRQVAIANATLATVVQIAIYVNVAWSLVNLLPVLPLDGGSATNALLSMVLRRDATRIVQAVSVAVAIALVVVALSLRSTFGALMAGYFAVLNISGLASSRRPRAAGDLDAFRPRAARRSRVADGRLGRRPAPADPRATTEAGTEATTEAGTEATDVAAEPTPRAAVTGGRPRRTFADEVAAVRRALDAGQPELAMIGIERAEPLALDTAQRSTLDALRARAITALGGT